MNLISICSTPIWQGEYPEFENDKDFFLKLVKDYKEKNPSVKKSNIMGYQSPGTLHQIPELRPLFEYICQMTYKAIEDLDFIECDVAITESWLNINNNRYCRNSEHVHDGIFSGVFYLFVPDESGKLIIQNHSINRMWEGFLLISQKNQFTTESIHIDPVEGDIILFPSYLPHSVEPNNHDDERISISFNVIALPKGSINYPQQDE